MNGGGILIGLRASSMGISRGIGRAARIACLTDIMCSGSPDGLRVRENGETGKLVGFALLALDWKLSKEIVEF